ncbi:MAG: thioesterase [Burkholderia sp.]|jgi:surfactin synthase thioesterase subunit|uniref:thioesterase II family protein n=2 Tax=Burkholderiaceae TaxID=119060 RepID=UPI0015886A52|nr:MULTISPECIES: alpha/beta fold hydrolase [Burkholderia]MBY8608721.1 alpha/beta fold hydrolase [Burkholderia arboris]MCA3781739.1 thioesterase [Burkholderia sp.]MCA3785979.1 thioesterase [Burkholderia sp.]MCA3791457.1 thioesterase [Burkholderia sp.]MCA3803644.1 thioesterase [Burkholderia sp.]
MALLPSTLTIPLQRPAARHRLLVFHHACGAAANYTRWGASFPDDIEVWLIELPGRGRSLGTRAIDTLPELIDFLRALRPLLPRDYSVFGHSMGALIAYSFACDMTQLGHPPVWFGASGTDAPFYPHRQTRFDGAPVHLRNDAEIVDYVVSLGGTPREVVEHDALRAMLLKLARADFRLVEAFYPLPSATALPCPVTVFSSRDDTVLSPAGQRDWSRASQHPVSFREFDGGHFYLLEHPAAVQHAIGQALADAGRCDTAVGEIPSLM